MTANAPDDEAKAGDTPPPSVVVLCNAAPFREGLAHAFGQASADIDPAALADRLAAERGWAISRTNIYHSSDARLDEDHRKWVERLKDTQSTLVTQPGDIRVRMALDGMRALRERQAFRLLIIPSPSTATWLKSVSCRHLPQHRRAGSMPGDQLIRHHPPPPHLRPRPPGARDHG